MEQPGNTCNRWHGAARSCVAFLMLLLCGCGTVHLEAPPGHESVRMMATDEPAEVRVERTLWYWAWGGKPISNNTTAPEIEQYDLAEVRMQTRQTVLDNVLNSLLGLFSVVRRTMVVEGNPRGTAQP